MPPWAAPTTDEMGEVTAYFCQNVETAKRFVDAANRRDVKALFHLATAEASMSSQLLLDIPRKQRSSVGARSVLLLGA